MITRQYGLCLCCCGINAPKETPMRRLARFALFPACIAFGFAAVHLALILFPPDSRQSSAARLTPVIAPVAAPKTETVSAPWPALFGVYQPPEPQPPAPVAPPPPPTPPLASLGFSLRGIFSKDSESWAILGHPNGDSILRVGDQLIDGVTLSEITSEGIWVETARGRELLGFPE